MKSRTERKAAATSSVHPRLFLGPEDVEGLRRRIRTGWGRKVMEALREKARPLVDALLASKDLPGLLTHHTVRKDPKGTAVVESLADVALVAVLDRDAAALEAVRRSLVNVPEAERLGPIDTYCLGYASWGNIQLAYDLTAPQLPPDDRAVFTQWAVDCSIRRTLGILRQNRYLHHGGFNVTMVGMIAALLSLLAVEGDPGAPDLAEEKAELLLYFEASLFASMGPNGYPFEDIGYGSGMVSLLSRLVEATRRAGLYDAYTQCPPYTRFGQAMLHFAQPWGKFLSNTGDYGADFGWRSVVFPRLATETRDPSLLWLHGTLSYPVACSGPMDMKDRLTMFPELELAPGFQVPVDAYSILTLGDLKRPVHPSKARVPTQFMDPGRGIATFRSGWDADATFVVFDGAQRSSSAQGHEHDSGGHFSLSALGEYFAIDTGRYNSEQDQHNVVLVDGKSGHSTEGQWRMSYYRAVLTRYLPGDFVDAACVDNAQMSNCYWSKRWLGLVKASGKRGGADVPSYVWIVDDVNFANDYRQFWWTLNTHPDNRIELCGSRATIEGCDHGNCLDVFFALPNPEEYPKPHRLRWAKNTQLAGSYAYLSDRRKLARDYRRTVGNVAWGPSFARPRLVAKVSGYNGRFMSLLIPRRKGAPLPNVEQVRSHDGVLAMRITFGDVTDHVIFAYDHNLLDADDVSARGQWCVVRRDRKSGRRLGEAVFAR